MRSAAARSATVRSAAVRSAADAAPVTQGQVDRGHGPHGWQGAGWAIDKHTLTPKLRELLVTYGELAHATYDNLGMDRCNTVKYGLALQPPEHLLDYLTADYALAPSARASAPGTADKYKLPSPTAVTTDEGHTHTLSPVIHALAGRGELPPRARHWPLVDKLLDQAFVTISGLLVTFVDGGNGSRPLFEPDPATGRGKEERGAFIGYVAVSKPTGPDDEVDVALVWRGTIFKEEWESNFAQDDMATWDAEVRRKADSLTSARNASKVPWPWKVGVHSGFDDLYNRRTAQPGDGQELSPREVVREWLLHLMKEHNVTTITTTGHSLGGALSTVSAFGVANVLQANEWDSLDKTGWRTKVPPKVTNMSFASPRVGNYMFVSKFRELGVRALRVVNLNDPVPKVPGIWVQFLSSVLAAVPFFGQQADTDMDSWLVRATTWLYHAVTVIISPVWPSRWGYFHVGQVLQLDSGSDESVQISGPFDYHNLELYLRQLSKLGPKGVGSTSRNPLLLNKSADLLADKSVPADWWRVPGPRGCQLVDGRWVFLTPKQ